MATTIRQKIAALYITASTEFSNPGSLMRNSSFLIWVWLPLIWNRVFLIWGALPPMRNTPFLIRVWLPLTWNSPFLIGGALPPRRNSPFLIRVWLPLIWNDGFLIWGALPSMRNGSSLIRVCLPPMRKSRFLILGEGFPIQGSWLSGELRKPQAGRVWSPVRRDGIPQLRKSRASNSVKAAVPV